MYRFETASGYRFYQVQGEKVRYFTFLDPYDSCFYENKHSNYQEVIFESKTKATYFKRNNMYFHIVASLHKIVLNSIFILSV